MFAAFVDASPRVVGVVAMLRASRASAKNDAPRRAPSAVSRGGGVVRSTRMRSRRAPRRRAAEGGGGEPRDVGFAFADASSVAGVRARGGMAARGGRGSRIGGGVPGLSSGTVVRSAGGAEDVHGPVRGAPELTVGVRGRPRRVEGVVEGVVVDVVEGDIPRVRSRGGGRRLRRGVRADAIVRVVGRGAGGALADASTASAASASAAAVASVARAASSRDAVSEATLAA